MGNGIVISSKALPLSEYATDFIQLCGGRELLVRIQMISGSTNRFNQQKTKFSKIVL